MENSDTNLMYTAFEGEKLLTTGKLDEVALKIKKRLKAQPAASILVFSDATGKEMDLDLRGSEADVLERLKVYLSPKEAAPAAPGPGRPKLGVVAREVSLLPRHWEWLSTQTGGASATLRRLIDDAKKASSGKALVQNAQERTYKFMSVLAGNLPHYEEALRALYAKDKKKFQAMTRDWPADVREHAKSLAAPVWP
ncbi:MAG: DUF2239 family protein [Bdellovibrionaceae bacterium]|nr:DUF2239 family protein [Pseudobdellovibrionaceae bacterium]